MLLFSRMDAPSLMSSEVPLYEGEGFAIDKYFVY